MHILEIFSTKSIILVRLVLRQRLCHYKGHSMLLIPSLACFHGHNTHSIRLREMNQSFQCETVYCHLGLGARRPTDAASPLTLHDESQLYWHSPQLVTIHLESMPIWLPAVATSFSLIGDQEPQTEATKLISCSCHIFHFFWIQDPQTEAWQFSETLPGTKAAPA